MNFDLKKIGEADIYMIGNIEYLRLKSGQWFSHEEKGFIEIKSDSRSAIELEGYYSKHVMMLNLSKEISLPDKMTTNELCERFNLTTSIIYGFIKKHDLNKSKQVGKIFTLEKKWIEILLKERFGK